MTGKQKIPAYAAGILLFSARYLQTADLIQRALTISEPRLLHRYTLQLME